MPNPASAQTGGLELTAACQPDPITVSSPGDHEVSIENLSSDPYYVSEIQVHVLQGGPGSGMVLADRQGNSGYLMSIRNLGTYGQWSAGRWRWLAQRQSTPAQSERIRTTVLFDRSSTLDPLDPTPPPMGLNCLCETDVGTH